MKYPAGREFCMRKAIFFLVVFGLAGSLQAGDPMVGSWKLNIEKSVFPSSVQAPPKELIQVIRTLDRSQGEFIQTGIRTDGTPIYVRYTVPREGGVVKAQTPLPEGVSIVVKKVDSHNVRTTYIQDGDKVAEIHGVVSKDGKTLTQTTRFTDDEGKLIEQIEVFDKQ
jgi:hypothetical protein